MKTEYGHREDLVRIGAKLYAQGMVAGTNGNVSVRIDTDEILTSPLGASLGALDPEAVLKTSMSGDVIEGQGVVSVEYPMHLEVYRGRSDVRAVVHGHPSTSTGMAAARLSMTEPVLTEVLLGFGEIPLAEYAPPGTDAFPQSISDLVKGHDAILLANHGVVTMGKTLDEACHRIEVVELIARSMMAARQFGGGVVLSDAEAKELLEIRRSLTGGTADPSCTACREWTELSPTAQEGACMNCATCASDKSDKAAEPSAAGGNGSDEMVRRIATEVIRKLG